MRISCLAVLFLASGSLVFGQLESDTVTITSSRSIVLQPDQVAFDVSVSSSPDATLDQVVALLQGSGITAADLTGVFASSAQWFDAGPSWSFTFGVPLTKLRATVASLTMLQASIAKNKGGAALMFSVAGGRVSPELMQAQSCSLKDLVADAQVQAQKLAVSAGLIAGPIVAISDGSSGGASAIARNVLVPTALTRAGVFSFGSATTFLLSTSVSTPFTCFAEVKFKLLRYQ